MHNISVKVLLRISRFKVSLAVAFSGLAAAIVYSHSVTISLLVSIGGVFLFASGASVINQIQEVDFDAHMKRTSNRPLPNQELSTQAAIVVAGIFILSGSALFIVQQAWVTLTLGLLNILWYNGVYTPLKRKTAFAVVPGALTGAIPIFMGWTAAGGALFDPFPVLLGFFIFMWQVPHFWLLGFMYGSEYKNAGFPVMTDLFSIEQIKRLTYTWLLASSGSSILIVIFGHLNSALLSAFILLLNFGLLIYSYLKLFIDKETPIKRLFIFVNIFMLLVCLLIISDHLLLSV